MKVQAGEKPRSYETAITVRVSFSVQRVKGQWQVPSGRLLSTVEPSVMFYQSQGDHSSQEAPRKIAGGEAERDGDEGEAERKRWIEGRGRV